MNNYELAFLAAGEALVFAYLIARLRLVWRAVALSAACLPALYLSLEKASQFLTIDETYIIREPLALQTSIISQWFQRALRTTDALFGPLSEAIKQPVSPTFMRLGVLYRAVNREA